MQLFHKNKNKTPTEVVGKLVGYLEALEAAWGSGRERDEEKAGEEVSKYLRLSKSCIFGDEAHPADRAAVNEYAEAAGRTSLLHLLVANLQALDFESRKDAAAIFGACVRVTVIYDDDNQQEVRPGANYVRAHPEVLHNLFDGYNNIQIALNCGQMLRDCFRDSRLARYALEGEIMKQLFEAVEAANFEIASDAFAVFKDLLTRHKSLVAEYLRNDYTAFFARYSRLLQSQNFVTKRQSLKLLGEFLLDRENLRTMIKYVSQVENLCLMMNLLRDPSRTIQFEAFHVFKVFVANPQKPAPIVEILAMNKNKLVKYLRDFHTDKDDEQFVEEKAVIIKEISVLSMPSTPAAAPTTAPGVSS